MSKQVVFKVGDRVRLRGNRAAGVTDNSVHKGMHGKVVDCYKRHLLVYLGQKFEGHSGRRSSPQTNEHNYFFLAEELGGTPAPAKRRPKRKRL